MIQITSLLLFRGDPHVFALEFLNGRAIIRVDP